MEIVNESEHDKLKASYHRKAGKELNTQRIMSLKNLKAAVMDLIKKNAVETAIKVFLVLKISPDISLADQMDDIKRHVGKFLPEEFLMNRKMVHDQSLGKMATTKAKELMALTFIIRNFTPGMNGVYKGIVREYLQPICPGQHKKTTKNTHNKTKWTGPNQIAPTNLGPEKGSNRFGSKRIRKTKNIARKHATR